ncbi:uncharacterized protein LOC111086126 [Limulus polyphemus]|uniref:Uncharacterized protein LOC111086126 n=1 Tax=Limulus polyphemus TaxID=6850 RepID=A0ABM1SIK2_LIMPO|nr:uncharacterized protein LOC111086126 [Limulus polyphemus]
MTGKEATLIFLSLTLTCIFVTKSEAVFPEFWKSVKYDPILKDEYKNIQGDPRIPEALDNDEALLLGQSDYQPWEEQVPFDRRLLPSKRQIRYNQCYFNPISCFRKRN